MVDPGTASLILGGAGLLSGKEKQKESDRYADSAADVNNVRAGMMKEAGGLARGYDPVKESAGVMKAIDDRAGVTLQSTIKKLNSDFKLAGGSPTGDTAFDTSLDRAVKGVMDPVRLQQANVLSNATMMKLNAFQAAMGMGGGLAENYMALSDATRPDNSGSLGLIAGGIDAMGKNKKAKNYQQGMGQRMMGWGLGLGAA